MKVSDLKVYKDSLYSAFCRDISDFEKNFLLISGGLLAFSITFIKEIIEIDKANNLFLLFIAWSLIIIAIALMMFAFLRSARYSDQLWKKTDDFIINNQLYQDETILSTQQINTIKTDINVLFYEGKRHLKNLRYFSVSAFVAGLLIFSIFVSINLAKEKKVINNPKAQKNIVIKLDSIELISTDSTLNFIYDRKIHGRTSSEAKPQPGTKADSTASTKTSSTATKTST